MKLQWNGWSSKRRDRVKLQEKGTIEVTREGNKGRKERSYQRREQVKLQGNGRSEVAREGNE